MPRVKERLPPRGPGLRSARTISDGRSRTFPFLTHHVGLGDGDVAFFDAGEGLPVVFVHGLVGDFTHFEHVAPGIVGAGHRALGIDLPGCGDSHKRRARYGVSGYADDVVRFLDARGIDKAVLVGHSAGGAVVAEATLQHPKRVAGLALLSSAGLRSFPIGAAALSRLLVRPWLLERTLEHLAMPLLDLVFESRNVHTEKFVRDSLDRPVMPTLREMSRVMADLLPELCEPTILRRMREIRVPTLVMWGDKDGLVPMKSAALMKAALSHARLRPLTSCGHMPMIEKPEVVVAEMIAFLEPLRARAPKAA